MTNSPGTGQFLIFSTIQVNTQVSLSKIHSLVPVTGSPFSSHLHIWIELRCQLSQVLPLLEHSNTVWLQEKVHGTTCTSNRKIFPQSIQRPSRELETQKAQIQHTAETTALSCTRNWFNSKKPSSVLSAAQGNVLGIENHKNNQHTHLNPNKPICTEPVKPPLRASVIPYIWLTFFREITEALQLVPKAQREGENPQYT